MCRKFQRYARRQTNRQTQTSRYSVPLSGVEWWFQVVAFSVLCPFVDMAFSFLTLLVGRQEGHPALKTEWWGAGVVICLERDADLHMAQLMPLPLVVSCFSKIQIGTFLVPAHLGSPGQGAVKRVCVSICRWGIAVQVQRTSLDNQRFEHSFSSVSVVWLMLVLPFHCIAEKCRERKRMAKYTMDKQGKMVSVFG